MIKKVIEWNNVKEKLPEKDGYYLTNTNNCLSINVVWYSCKLKAFNCRNEDEYNKYKLNVKYWAKVENVVPQGDMAAILNLLYDEEVDA